MNAAQKARVTEGEIQEAINNPALIEQAQQFIQNDQWAEPAPAELIEQPQKPQEPQVEQAYVTTPTSEMLQSLIQFEGTIAYQTATGSYKNGRFYPYQDTEGMAIGYGHNFSNDDFSNGITDEQALQILQQDAQIAINGATKILQGYNVTTKAHAIVAEMVFQMGEPRVRGFVEMLKALKINDYNTASMEMLNSEWATKTPKRAGILAEKMKNN